VLVSLGGPLRSQITLPKPNLADHTLTHGSVCSSPVPGNVGLVSMPVLNGSLHRWLFIIVTLYILLVLYYLHCLYTLLTLFVLRLTINQITSCNDCTFILVLGVDANTKVKICFLHYLKINETTNVLQITFYNKKSTVEYCLCVTVFASSSHPRNPNHKYFTVSRHLSLIHKPSLSPLFSVTILCILHYRYVIGLFLMGAHQLLWCL
jgi:hypothetical protein